MRNTSAILYILTILCLLWVSPAAADPVATVQKAQGQASVVGPDKTAVPAKPGDEVMVHDTLTTGPDGSLQVAFPDGTLLALGPDSSLAVASAMDEDGDGTLGLNLLSGAARVLSSEVLRANPEAFEMRTPLGLVGIRGTEFGVLAEQDREVALLYEGGPMYYRDSQATDPAVTAKLCAEVGKGLRDAEEGIRLAKKKMLTALRKKIEKTRDQLLEYNTRYQCGH